MLVEEEAELSESSYASAAEDSTDDGTHISELKARREQLAKQVAEQVSFILCWIFHYVSDLMLCLHEMYCCRRLLCIP